MRSLIKLCSAVLFIFVVTSITGCNQKTGGISACGSCTESAACNGYMYCYDKTSGIKCSQLTNCEGVCALSGTEAIACSGITCEDSDGGQDFFEKGTVTVGASEYEDTCSEGGLVEFYCSGSDYNTLYKDCSNFGNDYVCQDGACKAVDIGCTNPSASSGDEICLSGDVYTCANGLWNKKQECNTGICEMIENIPSCTVNPDCHDECPYEMSGDVNSGFVCNNNHEVCGCTKKDDGCFHYSNCHAVSTLCGDNEKTECRDGEIKCEGKIFYSCYSDDGGRTFKWSQDATISVGHCGVECINDIDCNNGEVCSHIDRACKKINNSCEKFYGDGAIQLLFIGANYPDMKTFKDDVGFYLTANTDFSFLNIEPFKSYKNKFSIMYSEELLNIEKTDVGSVSYDAKKICPQADFFVILDTTDFRSFSVGGGAFVSKAYVEQPEDFGLVITHELAHCIGKLDDEYVEEGNVVNFTNCKEKETDFSQIVKTYKSFKGCGLEQYYRSSDNSIMRDSGMKNNGNKFNDASTYYLKKEMDKWN